MIEIPWTAVLTSMMDSSPLELQSQTKKTTNKYEINYFHNWREKYNSHKQDIDQYFNEKDNK